MKRFFTLLGISLSFISFNQAQVLVAEFVEGSQGPQFPGGLSVVNNSLYYLEDKAAWKIEEKGQVSLFFKQSFMHSFFPGGSLIYIQTEDADQDMNGMSDHGWELWVTDGTPNNTYMLKDMAPGEASSLASPIFYYKGFMYFFTVDGFDKKLWRTNGVKDNVEEIIDNNNNPIIVDWLKDFYFLEFDNMLYCVANGGSLWKTNGLNTKFQKVMDNTNNQITGISHLQVIDNLFYYTKVDNSIWRLNGNIPEKLVDPSNQVVSNLMKYNNSLYFSRWDNNLFKHFLWKADSAPNNASKVLTSDGSELEYGSIISYNNSLCMLSRAHTGGGNFEESKLWKIDTDPIESLKDNANNPIVGIQWPFTFGNSLYFTVKNANDKYALWKSDGITSNPILTGYNGIYISQIEDNNFYFKTINDNGKYELWKSDGNTFNPITGGYKELGISYKSGNNLYYYIKNENDKYEILKVGEVAPVTSEFNNLEFNSFTFFNGDLYFVGEDDKSIKGIYKLDINTSPTELTLSNNSIMENESIGTLVGELSCIDADLDDVHSYSFLNEVGGEDNALFSLDVQKLNTNAEFDYETKKSYNVRIRVTDSGNNTFDKNFIISVTNDISDDQSTEIDKTTNVNIIHVYPNPVKEQLQLQLPASNYMMNVYNRIGELIITNKIDSKNLSVNCTSLKSGIYFIQLTDNSGNSIIRSFVKE